MEILFKFFVFMFGGIWGSFAAMLVYRLPRGKSVLGSSRCESCDGKIPFYLNIPIFGYLILMGKCHQCGKKISLKNFFIELIVALIALWLFPDLSSGNIESSLFLFLFQFIVGVCLVVHFFVDIEFRILPDVINLVLAALFFVYSFFFFHWSHWSAGAGIGFGFTYLITYAFYKIKGKIGLGGGDIKLFGALGLYLGPFGILMNIFMSCFVGALIGVLLLVTKKINRETPVPFGPFIIIAAGFQIYFPDQFNQLSKFLFGL